MAGDRLGEGDRDGGFLEVGVTEGVVFGAECGDVDGGILGPGGYNGKKEDENERESAEFLHCVFRGWGHGVQGELG